MNKAFAGAFDASAPIAGWKTKSEQGGGTGTDTFCIIVPGADAKVRRGEVHSVRLGLERGDGFNQRVTLEATGPAGIRIDQNESTVQPGRQCNVQLRIVAAQDAPAGEYSILVNGTPDQGNATRVRFTITVGA